ncbi:hypothetical protein [Bacillus luti]|uniref:hypothetical protein n=1 Tax=Bacillus luti TaxID=2026191 RepID=UPI0037744831
MKKGQQIVLCPQCGGNKVKSPALASKDMLWLSALSCITIIGIPIGIILFFVALRLKYTKMKLKFRCVECTHEFKVEEKTFNEYIKAIS